MNETFPHHYEDGYVITNSGWATVSYAGIYKETNGMPYQWNTSYKRHKPIAQFVIGQRRGNKVDCKRCWYGCDLKYKYSAN